MVFNSVAGLGHGKSKHWRWFLPVSTHLASFNLSAVTLLSLTAVEHKKKYKVNVKLSLPKTWRDMGGVEVWIRSFLNLTLDGVDRWLEPRQLYPREWIPVPIE